MKLAAEQRRAHLLGGAGWRKGRRHQPLALRQKGVEPLNKIARIDDAEKFDIVGGKHDAIIRRSLSDMPAAGRQGKSQPAPTQPRPFEVADPDADVVDARDNVVHGRLWGALTGKLNRSVPRGPEDR